MKENNDVVSGFLKVWFLDFLVLRFLLLLPGLILITLIVYHGPHKILDWPILIFLILIYYITLIPISKLYIHYRDKRESQKKLELRKIEDKVFRKNIRK